tara:strand:- start:4127 stop:4570 length:444 start_codon:yes stop_codon:yes gene_type:complete
MSKVNLDIAEKLDITCRRGDTFSLTLTLKDSSDTALQLSTLGYEFFMNVKSNEKDSSGERFVIASSSTASQKSPTSSRLTDDQVQKLAGIFTFDDASDSGTVVLNASAASMASFPVGRFSYDIQQLVGGVRTTILRGSFKVNEDITL